MRISIDNTAIEQKLGTIKNLPTLPLVLRQVQKVMHDPKSNMGQIAMIVAKDQALASHTIRLVNSAFYGMRERVTSISNAIVILGLNTLNNIMIGISVVTLFKDAGLSGFDLKKYWEHCFGAALLAKHLAELKGKKDVEEFFTAGLLHDMGKLVLEQFLHGEFSRSLLSSKIRKKPLFEGEKMIVGFDHANVGAWLGQKWGLPDVLVASMGFHHSRNGLPEELLEFSETVRIVSTANELCNYGGIGLSGDIVPEQVAVDGLSAAQINELIEKARSEVASTVEEWNKAL